MSTFSKPVSDQIIYTPMIPAKTQASHSQGVIVFGLKITLMTKISWKNMQRKLHNYKTIKYN